MPLNTVHAGKLARECQLSTLHSVSLSFLSETKAKLDLENEELRQ